MPVHLRPFGLVGSLVEVAVGLYLLRSVLWTNEKYGASVVLVVGGLSAIVLVVGVVGLSMTIARWRRANTPQA